MLGKHDLVRREEMDGQHQTAKSLGFHGIALAVEGDKNLPLAHSTLARTLPLEQARWVSRADTAPDPGDASPSLLSSSPSTHLNPTFEQGAARARYRVARSNRPETMAAEGQEGERCPPIVRWYLIVATQGSWDTRSGLVT